MQWPHAWRSTCRSSSESGKDGGEALGRRSLKAINLMGKRPRRGEEGPPESRDQAGDFTGRALEALDTLGRLTGGWP